MSQHPPHQPPPPQQQYPAPQQPYPSPQRTPHHPDFPPPRNDVGLIGGVILICASLAFLAFCMILTPIAAIPGIVAISKNNSDPEGATRWMIGGWVTLAVMLALSVVLWFTFFASLAGGTLWFTGELMNQMSSSSAWPS